MARRGLWIPAVFAWFAVLALAPRGAFGGSAAPPAPEPLRIKDFLYDLDRGLRTGPVALHAYLSEHASYNDNVFLNESSRKSDFVFDTLGGARVDLRYGHAKARLLGELEYFYTIAEADYNHLDATVALEGRIESRSTFLEIRDEFRYRGMSENLYHTPLGNFLTYMNNDAGLQAGVQLARIGIEVDGGITHWFFADKEVQYLDHMEIRGSVKLSYNLRKLKIFLSGDFGMVDFTGEYDDGTQLYKLNDYMYYGVSLGFDYELTGKINLFLSVGFRMQDVEEGEGTVIDDKSYTGFVANLSLSYRMTYKVTMGLTYYRSLEFSGTSNYQTTDFASAFYRHEILPRFSVKISPRFMYVMPSAHDKFMILGGYLLLDYRLWEWFHAGLRYDFRMRQTDRTDGSYLNNVVSLTLTGYF